MENLWKRTRVLRVFICFLLAYIFCEGTTVFGQKLDSKAKKLDGIRYNKDDPRNDSVLYKQFKIRHNEVLKAEIIEERGCKWRKGIHRVNNSRFFILDTFDRKDVECNFTVARDFCNSLNQEGSPTGKWRLARVEHLSTFRLITREIERGSVLYSHVKGTGYKDSWYWIDAFFNYYIFTSTHERMFLKGIGGHERWNDSIYNHTKYNPAKNPQQCLTLALPWPNESEKEKYKNATFGHQSSFDERACESVQKFKPMCESLNPKCRHHEDIRNFNYFPIEGYAQKSYTDDGVWIFSNRRFLVNLKPRNKDEAKEFYESLGTKLYTPDKNDVCLIPYLKLWNIHLTYLNFWTTLKAQYSGLGEDKLVNKKIINATIIRYENNTRFSLHGQKKVAVYNLTLNETARSTQWDKDEKRSGSLAVQYLDLCVTANWVYEYPNETSWIDTTNINWNFLSFAYANCNMYMGTICEPPIVDFQDEHKCNWKKGWTANYEGALVRTAVLEFGYRGSGIYRSTYKQQFGQHICQTVEKFEEGTDYEISYDTLDYHRVTVNELDTKVEFYYDYLEPYWVVDHTFEEKDWFNNATKDVEACKLSQAILIEDASGDQLAFRREVKTVNCLEWHFYLCGPEEFEPWLPLERDDDYDE